MHEDIKNVEKKRDINRWCETPENEDEKKNDQCLFFDNCHLETSEFAMRLACVFATKLHFVTPPP